MARGSIADRVDPSLPIGDVLRLGANAASCKADK
jgi:hypothetical protein